MSTNRRKNPEEFFCPQLHISEGVELLRLIHKRQVELANTPPKASSPDELTEWFLLDRLGDRLIDDFWPLLEYQLTLHQRRDRQGRMN